MVRESFRQAVGACAVVLGVASILDVEGGGFAFAEGPVVGSVPGEGIELFPIPDWLLETTGVGYTLSGMATADRERAVAHGVTISELIFVDPLFAYYESRLLERRSPHVPLERIERDVAEYDRLGLRILAVYPPALQGEVWEKHPEWRRVTERSGGVPEVDLEKQPWGGPLCLLGPYGDFLIDVVAEILERFPSVDAFSFDGLHHGGFCYCASCTKRYREATGAEIPAVDMNDPAYRRYLRWADRRLEDLVSRLQRRLKGIRPDVGLVTWTTNAGRFGHLRDIPRNMPARMNLLFDAPDQELWLDESNRGATIVPAFGVAYAWAVSNHRVAFSEPYLMSHGNPYGKDSFPPHEVERRMLLAVAHGVGPSIAVAQPAYLKSAVEDALLEVKRRKPWLTREKPEAWAAILVSDDSRVFYGRSPGEVEERYLASPFGVFRAAIEAHLPSTLICDWNLRDEDLSPYALLVLPNVACLSDEGVAAITRFVERGGGLVASLDTSRFDESGDVRDDFALARLFGASYDGRPADDPSRSAPALDENFARNLDPRYAAEWKGIFDLVRRSDGLFAPVGAPDYLTASPVTFKGAAVRVRLHGEREEASPARIAAELSQRPPGAGDPIPAITTSKYGEGKVVYFAAGIGAAYYRYPYPYERDLIVRSMLHAASRPPPVEIKAPMCVHATLLRQTKDGERLVLHLYSDLDTTASRAFPLDAAPLREESIPIAGVEVTFHGYAIRRIHWEPDGVELEPRRGAEKATGDVRGDISVTVPPFGVHGMVVAELERAR